MQAKTKNRSVSFAISRQNVSRHTSSSNLSNSQSTLAIDEIQNGISTFVRSNAFYQGQEKHLKQTFKTL